MKIKILNRFYDLTVIPQTINMPDQLNWGIINHNEATIAINNKVNSALRLETLLHECIHSVDSQLNLDFDEKIIDKITCGVYSIIMDNDWTAIKEFLVKK